MVCSVFWAGLLAMGQGCFVAWLGTRWSRRLIEDAVVVYGGLGQSPQMRWANQWFVLWFVGNVMGLIAVFPGSFPLLAVWISWLALLGLLGFIDAKTGLLPNELTLLMMLAGLASNAMASESGLPAPSYTWGMVLGWLLPWSLNRIHELWRGKLAIGEGDAKLLGAIGAWLGLQALPLVWVIACLATLVYTALVYIAGHGRPRYVTFGPFLAVGASLVMLLNHV